ncbi:CRP-like cAMP-binding protein [Sphingomonas kyeonggiensis]|uniref:Crp/Fnr family transcriptional regulator n=1 Tax=Sphingomonas kyeonggiensis TaxID=1268553 RepID=UPI002785386B|nr:Crp/Fnr family transcriptional regulator [Sphingomonas kyeonggiensis]MDQ0249015.1 CRP-like cAMP-binding protein [Sphingomonas kyeonggiensis]
MVDEGARGAEEAPPAALLDRILPRARTMRIKASQIVVGHSTLANDVYFVLSGSFEVSITARDGVDVVVRDLGPGAIFGDLSALDRQPRSANVIATSDSKLASVPAEIFLAAVSEIPEASRWFMNRLGREVRRLTDRIFELSALAARGRLHCELLRLAGTAPRAGDRVQLEPAPTHEALAQRIGSQREAVSRELAQLSDAGVLRRGRKWIELDIVQLARLVEVELGYPLSLTTRPDMPAQPAVQEA